MNAWQRQVAGGVAPGSGNFASLWDFVETAGNQRGILIAIEGPFALAVTRLLAERATRRFPRAKIAAASTGEAAWESFTRGATLPVSPYRPLGRFIGLEAGRSSKEVRVGYDLVFREGASETPDMRILLQSGGSYRVESLTEVKGGQFETAARTLGERLFSTSNAEVDALLDLLDMPVDFGSGPLGYERPINKVSDITEDEERIYHKLAAWYWPLFTKEASTSADLKYEMASLLREKLNPSQLQTLRTLLDDAIERTDFFSLVATARVL